VVSGESVTQALGCFTPKLLELRSDKGCPEETDEREKFGTPQVTIGDVGILMS
jgi:hypothetical protein